MTGHTEGNAIRDLVTEFGIFGPRLDVMGIKNATFLPSTLLACEIIPSEHRSTPLPILGSPVTFVGPSSPKQRGTPFGRLIIRPTFERAKMDWVSLHFAGLSSKIFAALRAREGNASCFLLDKTTHRAKSVVTLLDPIPTPHKGGSADLANYWRVATCFFRNFRSVSAPLTSTYNGAETILPFLDTFHASQKLTTAVFTVFRNCVAVFGRLRAHSTSPSRSGVSRPGWLHSAGLNFTSIIPNYSLEG